MKYTKTVDAEITAATNAQRARGAESRAVNEPSNGPQRAQSKGICLSILRRMASVTAPGVCWYLAKCASSHANQGGTADNRVYSSLTDGSIPDCQGLFLCPKIFGGNPICI